MAGADDFVNDLLHTEGSLQRFEELKPKYALYRDLIEARRNAKLTQQEIAERMGTSISSVSRLEKGESPPSLRSLERYAEALGHHLEIRLVPNGNSTPDSHQAGQSRAKQAFA